MEFMPHGDLERYIEHPWDEIDARVVTEQVLLALKYLHRHGIAHRNIKAPVSELPQPPCLTVHDTIVKVLIYLHSPEYLPLLH